jgi:hypothetical protein
VRLQVYARRWDRAITEPLREPPPAHAAADSYQLF